MACSFFLLTIGGVTVSGDELNDDPESPSVNEAVLKTVVESFYQDAVRAGTAARVRAQASQSVTALVASGLVTTFTLAGLDKQAIVPKLLGCAAVLSWAVAALLYLRAVGRPAPIDSGMRGVEEPGHLVRVVLDR